MTDRELFTILLGNQPLRKGDVIALLEGDGLVRVPYAAELFQNGMASLVVVVGGDTRREYGSFVGSELKAALLNQGVPESAVYVEETAGNTKEETDRFLRLAQERGWKRMLIVTSPHHQYRAFLTFVQSAKRLGLEIELINAPVRDLPWFEVLPWGQRAELLKGEFERIEMYQSRGDVASFEEGIAYLRLKESPQTRP